MKFKYLKLEDIPENIRSFYQQGQDGAYYLQVEGAVDKARLDEFRDNNTKLMRELEAFKGIDPKKVQEMQETQRKLEEKKLIDAGDFEGLVSQRVATMKQSYEDQINQLTQTLNTSNRQLEVLLIDNAVREHAIKSGVIPTAVDDVLLRAKTVFKVEEGRPVAKDAKGNTLYGKDGQNSLSLGEWLGGLKDQAPHLFVPSTGSGAHHSKGTTGNPGGANLSAAQKIAQGLSKGSTIVS